MLRVQQDQDQLSMDSRMEYQPDAGHQGAGSELIYLPNSPQYQTQALSGHHVGYYQNAAAPFHQFVDKKLHHYGKPGAGHELLVPACSGSNSSEASDDGLLRYAYPETYLQQETQRCDSSRSESTCSSMSSGSGAEDGLVRVPLLLPQGFTTPNGYLPQHGLLRFGHPNGMKLVKPAEMEQRVYDQNVYCVRPNFEPDNRTAPVVSATVVTNLQPVPLGWRRLLVDNSVIYLTPSNAALSSMDQVKMYLMSAGTCKCGLECPVHCDVVFNFNPKIASRPWDASDSEMTKLCNHKRKTVESLDPRPLIEPVNNNNDNVADIKEQHRDLSNLTQPPTLLDVPTTLKKRRRKQTFGGVSVSQLLAQRERERAMATAAAAAVANGPRWPVPMRMPARIYPEAYAIQPQLTAIRPQDPFTAMFPPGNRPRNIPPWHQQRFAIRKPLNPYERVPPLQQHMPPPQPLLPIVPQPVIADLRRKHKPYREKKRKVHEPTFMDDPNGYLAQQTALLHNTIARPNMMQGVPMPSNILPPKRPHQHSCVTTGCTDCGNTGNDSSVTSTVVADPRPIQGGAISTSNGSPTPLDPPSVCALPAQSPSNLLVTSSFDSPSQMRTVSKATHMPATQPRRDVVQTVVSNIQTSTTNGHILVSNTGQYLSGLKLNQPMGTVLVNALPAPFVLQPGVMTVDTGLGPMAVAGNVLVDNHNNPLLSPVKKKKGKKRKGTPLGSPLLQVPHGNNVMLNQGFGGMQAVTLVQGMQGVQQVQGKPVMVNNPINVLQPMVHNFPIQQFLVPGLGNMVMASDGSTTLLPDHSMPQLQLQPLLTNTSFITTPTGMLIRSPNNLVNQVSPTEYIQIVPQSNASVVQNTTIVQQQTTMMGNMNKALELEIVASNAAATTAADVSTQTGQGKETSHTFCQTVGSPPDTTTCSPIADTTTDDQQTVTSSVTDDKLRLHGYLSPNGRDDGVGSSHSDMLSGVSLSLDYMREKPEENVLKEGDLVWGPVGGSPAWPGKIISPVYPDGVVNVRWFGGISSPSRIRVTALKNLSQGLDTHHQACQSPKRARKLRVELQAAIQEAMTELDKITAKKQRNNVSASGRTRRSLR